MYSIMMIKVTLLALCALTKVNAFAISNSTKVDLAVATTDLSGSTIVDLAIATPDLLELVTLLKVGKLVDTLSGPGPFTVFAPTNEAFAKVPTEILDYLLDPDYIKVLDDVLTYHVVADKGVHAADLLDGESIETFEGGNVVVTRRGGSVFINDAKVTTADIDASNGVVHIIDTVLFPKTATGSGSTIVDIAVATPELLELVTLLTDGKLVDTLSGPGPFTVFAPSNEAFAKLPAATLDYLFDPYYTMVLDDVLTYHVVSGAMHVADLLNAENIRTVEGNSVVVTFKGPKSDRVFINDAQVTTADIDASNGVVHIIDTVLFPKTAPFISSTIVDLAKANDFLSTLTTALTAAGNFVDYLSSPGPFTVFAPTNKAFLKLPNATLAHLLDPRYEHELDTVLLYHVASGTVHATDLSNGEKIPTLEGKDVKVTIKGDRVFINDAQVTNADIDASNGVVHVIDTVLIPPVI